MMLIDRICLRAQIDGKWGSYTIREMLDAGLTEEVVAWALKRLVPSDDMHEGAEQLMSLLPYGSYVAVKDPDEESNYQVPGDLHKAKLKELANELKNRLPASMGFLVLLFDYSVGENHGATFYASTASRKESIELLEEQIKHLKETDNGTGEHQETKSS